MAATKRTRKNNNRAGKMCISIILVAFVVAMSVQIVKIYQKDQELIEVEAERRLELEEETERSKKLEEYEAHTKSTEYTEDVARSKCGLAYDNEIIFKEED